MNNFFRWMLGLEEEPEPPAPPIERIARGSMTNDQVRQLVAMKAMKSGMMVTANQDSDGFVTFTYQPIPMRDESDGDN